MHHFLTREQIRAASKRRYGEIDVPELGGKVRISTLNAKASLELRALQRRAERGEEVESAVFELVLSASLVDGAGKQLYDVETAPELLDLLGFDVATRLVQQITEFISGGKKPAEGEEAPANPSVASPSAA